MPLYTSPRARLVLSAEQITPHSVGTVRYLVGIRNALGSLTRFRIRRGVQQVALARDGHTLLQHLWSDKTAWWMRRLQR